MKASKFQKSGRAIATPTAPVAVVGAAMVSVTALMAAANVAKAAHFAQVAPVGRSSLRALVPPDIAAEIAKKNSAAGQFQAEVDKVIKGSAPSKSEVPSVWSDQITLVYPLFSDNNIQGLVTMTSSLTFQWMIGKDEKLDGKPVSILYQISNSPAAIATTPLQTDKINKSDMEQEAAGVASPIIKPLKIDKPQELLGSGVVSSTIKKSTNFGDSGTFALDNSVWKKIDWSRVKTVEHADGKDSCVIYVRGVLVQGDKQIAPLPNAVKVTIIYKGQLF